MAQIDKKFLAKLLDINESEIFSNIKGLTFDSANAPEGVKAFRDLLSERRRKRIEALAEVLRAEDDLGKIVRAHIHIEHELQEVIFLAAPNPTQLKSFDKMEYADKVQLALVLGLNAELKPALNATGNLRNKFSHRLDMKIGEEEVTNLISTFTPSGKQQFQKLLRSAVSELPRNALEGEALSYFQAQIKATIFFLQLFDEVAKERHRLAFEKMQGMAWH
jgi:hypothetical protein